MSVSSLMVSLADLAASGLEQVIAGCEPTYRAYSARFETAAQTALEANETARSQAYRLLAAACRAMLTASDSKTPFRPFFEMAGRRGVVSADLTASQVEALVGLSKVVADPELVSRLADIGWSVRRDVDSARRAVAMYLASSRNAYFLEHWPERIKRLERALRIARMICADDSTAGSIVTELEAFPKPEADGSISRGVKDAGQLLLEFRRDAPATTAATFSRLATTLEADDPHRARDLHLLAAKGFRIARDEAHASASELQGANMLLETVERHKQAGETMVAAHWMAQAVSALQKLPGQAERIRSPQVELERLN